MPSLLQQLENETVLLMYLADELPADDRAEVEQLLDIDANLRGELQKLAAVQDQTMALLDELDRCDPPLVSADVGVRRLSRLIRQRLIEQSQQPIQMPVSPKGLPLPWWCYPLAASFAVVIASVVWWGMHADGISQGVPPQIVAVNALGIADELKQSLDVNETESNPNLHEAETQLLALSSGSNDLSLDFAGDR